MEPDPVGYAGGVNRYEYVRGRPLKFLDPTGLAPYDLFDTPEDAARDARDHMYPNTVGTNTEFCAQIYYVGNGRYSYNVPVRGSRVDCRALWTPAIDCDAGSSGIHSHGRDDDYVKAYDWSKQDKENNLARDLPGFLVTPDGRIKEQLPYIGASDDYYLSY
jgi:hypothetical protein